LTVPHNFALNDKYMAGEKLQYQHWNAGLKMQWNRTNHSGNNRTWVKLLMRQIAQFNGTSLILL